MSYEPKSKALADPITYDELVNSSSMDGLISFPDVRPGAPELSSAPANEASRRRDSHPLPTMSGLAALRKLATKAGHKGCSIPLSLRPSAG